MAACSRLACRSLRAEAAAAVSTGMASEGEPWLPAVAPAAAPGRCDRADASAEAEGACIAAWLLQEQEGRYFRVEARDKQA